MHIDNETPGLNSYFQNKFVVQHYISRDNLVPIRTYFIGLFKRAFVEETE